MNEVLFAEGIEERKTYEKAFLFDASPLALSFIGDSVHTLFVRRYVLMKSPYKNGELHALSAALCCAKSQSEAAKRMRKYLTEDEIHVYKRAKGAKVHSVPKNADILEYKEATALEAVVGYLYLLGEDERLNELLMQVYRPENGNKEAQNGQYGE